MSEPFLSEIRMYPYLRVPAGWTPCDGRSLTINSQTQALFALIGNKFGGDGRTTFNLPDLRGRVPVASSPYSNIPLPNGTAGGAENVALTLQQIPGHNHAVQVCSSQANSNSPVNAVWSQIGGPTDSMNTKAFYGPAPTSPQPLVPLPAQTLAPTGAGQGHPNMQPFIVLLFCICTASGYWPPRN